MKIKVDEIFDIFDPNLTLIFKNVLKNEKHNETKTAILCDFAVAETIVNAAKCDF